MKVIYVAGPYDGDVDANIAVAEAAGEAIGKDGRAFPLVPHLLGKGERKYMLAGTLELARRCDAVLVVGDWQTSVGTKGEIDEAARLGKRMFFEFDHLMGWLDREGAGE